MSINDLPNEILYMLLFAAGSEYPATTRTLRSLALTSRRLYEVYKSSAELILDAALSSHISCTNFPLEVARKELSIHTEEEQTKRRVQIYERAIDNHDTMHRFGRFLACQKDIGLHVTADILARVHASGKMNDFVSEQGHDLPTTVATLKAARSLDGELMTTGLYLWAVNAQLYAPWEYDIEDLEEEIRSRESNKRTLEVMRDAIVDAIFEVRESLQGMVVASRGGSARDEDLEDDPEELGGLEGKEFTRELRRRRREYRRLAKIILDDDRFGNAAIRRWVKLDYTEWKTFARIIGVEDSGWEQFEERPEGEGTSCARCDGFTNWVDGRTRRKNKAGLDLLEFWGEELEFHVDWYRRNPPRDEED